MVTIEYNRTKINVPENWDDITLGFYETFYKEKPETARERVALVAKVCKMDAELLLSWPAEVFNTIVGYIGFLYNDNPVPPSPVVEIDGVKYIVPIDDELTLGAWVDADEIQKKGENVLSNVLAVVCRPVNEEYDCKNNEARAAMFAGLPVKSILGVLAFFLQCKTVLDRRTAAYTKITGLYGQLPQNIKISRLLGGGIRLSLIWPTLKYYVLMILLRYQLRKFSRFYCTEKAKITRKKPSVS